MFEPKIIAQAQCFFIAQEEKWLIAVKFSRTSCPPILAMIKLGVLLLFISIEYFDHFQVKNNAENGFEKSLFFILSQHKSANIDICIFFSTEHYCPGSVFFYCSRGKGADETVKFGRNSCPPIFAMKKLGVLLLFVSIEYFDNFQVKNNAENRFEKSLFFILSQHKSANIDICIFCSSRTLLPRLNVFLLLKRKRC